MPHMSEISSSYQNERRAYHRLRVPDDILFVRNSYSKEELGTILDISLGGISFKYDQNKNQPEESNLLDIVSSDKSIQILKVAYQNVNDFEYIEGYPFASHRRRRRGICFEDLSSEQVIAIDRLLGKEADR